MAVALARLFYMMQGINPMTDSTKPRTLKDQLESETADTERSAAEDTERYHGGDWWQLTDAEESVFVIDRERFPRMITVWSKPPKLVDRIVRPQFHRSWHGANPPRANGSQAAQSRNPP
jgi:hypothetical protein